MMCRKLEKHEDVGPGAADNSGIILLLTCIRCYQMFPMQLTIFVGVRRPVEINDNVSRRPRGCSMLQAQEALLRSFVIYI